MDKIKLLQARRKEILNSGKKTRELNAEIETAILENLSRLPVVRD